MNAIMKVQCSNKATENIKLDVHGNHLRQQFSILVLSTLLPRNIFNPQQYIPTSETPNSFHHLLHNKNFKVSHICRRDIPYLHYSNYDNEKKNQNSVELVSQDITQAMMSLTEYDGTKNVCAAPYLTKSMRRFLGGDVKNARQDIKVITTYIIGGKGPVESSAER
jgi:hypothetical protein